MLTRLHAQLALVMTYTWLDELQGHVGLGKNPAERLHVRRLGGLATDCSCVAPATGTRGIKAAATIQLTRTHHQSTND
jgi:hypothetical protein